MKYMVTGVAGFIGFHVARKLLEEGNTVFGVDNLNNYYDIGLKRSRLEELKKFKKFTFYNQDIAHKALEIDFDTVRRFITDDNRIGKSHSKIAKKRGFGGHCFPKDADAILKSANEAGYDLSLIKEAVDYNKRIRWAKDETA